MEFYKAPWPGWETVDIIGKGSFGTVYKIQRELVDGETEVAALKVITIPHNPGDIDELYSEGYNEQSITDTFKEHLKSIVNEYSLMRKMDGSANVVNCKDISYIQHDDGIGWDICIRMELLTPLMKALPADIPEAAAIKMGRDICNALVLCKKYDIIHRDIKPQNIFQSSNGDYKLGDFGIAKAAERTMGGTRIGTYKYMAPEVYNNQPYGSAADIYSLGLVLYWMLNERRMPFLPLPPASVNVGMDEDARFRRFSGKQIPPPAHGSDALKQIVLKACAYDPKDRYASAAQMLADLNELDSGVAPIILDDPENWKEANPDDETALLDFGKKQDIPQDDAPEAFETVVLTSDPTFTQNEKAVVDSFYNSQQKPAKKSPVLKAFLIAAVVVLAIVLALLLCRCSGPVFRFAGGLFTNNGGSQYAPPSNQDGYNEQEAAAMLTSVSLHEYPNKTSYYVGESLDTSGLQLSASYSDGRTQIVNFGFTCSPTTLNSTGTQTIEVRYEGKTATFDVNVSEIFISSISVSALPHKTSYYVGESLDTSGLALTVNYNNGTTETVTSGFTCASRPLDSAGTQNVTVTYKGASTSFSVNVTDVSVNSISVKSYPGKTSYYVGESLNTSGLVLTVSYNNGKTETVTSGFNCTPNKFSSSGSQRVTVYFGDKNTSFDVSVKKPTITLSRYNDSQSLNCWDSYWNTGRNVPLWKLYLPSVTTTPGGNAVSWSIVSGSAYIAGDYIAAQQPGYITARASFDYCGYTYSADYTVELELYKVPSDINYLMSGPGRNYTRLDNVPAGVWVEMTEVAWDASVQKSDGKYYLWGKITYNGITGWIVIS